jgi:hypothetical protein
MIQISYQLNFKEDPTIAFKQFSLVLKIKKSMLLIRFKYKFLLKVEENNFALRHTFLELVLKCMFTVLL